MAGTEALEPEETPAEPPAAERLVVTPAQFNAVDIEAPIQSLNVGQAHAVADAYNTAQQAAEAAGDTDAAAVYSLLFHICRIALHPERKGDPWGAFSSGAGWRSAIPADFKGEQAGVIAGLVPSIVNPVLRARLADLVWTLDRTQGRMAHTAVAAYRATVDGLLSGSLTSEFKQVDGHELMLAQEATHRLVQIAYMTSKRGKMPDDVKATLQAVFDRTAEASAFAAFKRAATLGLEYGLLDGSAIVGTIMDVAGRPSDVPIVRKDLWDMAAHIFDQAGDQKARRKCQLRAVDELLEMRNHVSSDGARASWTMDALQALRHVKNVSTREDRLNRELRRYQKASLREMGMFSMPIDMKDEIEQVEEIFLKLDLPDALRQFALLGKSRPLAELDEEAAKSIQSSPLFSMMGSSLVDDEGRVAKRVEGVRIDGEPEEPLLLQVIDRLENIRRHMTMLGAIERARQVVSARFYVCVEHLLPIVGPSAFVPNSQAYIMAMGFAALLNGDFISAAHLVLPQLEPCLRQVLAINGIDAAKRRDDGTEEDLSLNSIFSRFRPDLDRILGANLSREIERLFDLRPGPALRHELAHGQLSAGACYHPNVVYAVWLIYRITCLFLLKDWEAIILPAIEAA